MQGGVKRAVGCRKGDADAAKKLLQQGRRSRFASPNQITTPVLLLRQLVYLPLSGSHTFSCIT